MWQSVSYRQLHSIWRRASRTGALRRLPEIKRGLFSAALCYAKMTGAIFNRRLIEMIQSVADQVLTIGQRILRRGSERARSLAMNMRVRRVFRQALQWLGDRAYVFWLGTDLLARRSRWILASTAPGSTAPPPARP